MPTADRGSTSLTTVLLTPVFIAVGFMAFQAALWTHARTEARTVARDAAVLVARHGEAPDAVERSSEGALNGSLLTNADVVIEPQGQIVVVTVRGNAPGILRWSSSKVEVVEALPIEGFRP